MDESSHPALVTVESSPIESASGATTASGTEGAPSGEGTEAGAMREDGADDLGAKAEAEAELLVQQAKSKAEPLKRDAEAFAEGKKQQSARAVADFAQAIHKAADDLGNQSPAVAKYIHASAARIESASGVLSDRSVGELFDDANRLAHERPLAVLAGSVAAGFLLARLLRASHTGPNTAGA